MPTSVTFVISEKLFTYNCNCEIDGIHSLTTIDACDIDEDYNLWYLVIKSVRMQIGCESVCIWR